MALKFVDTTTPTVQEYQDSTTAYSQQGSETTRQRANDWAAMYYQNAYNTAMTNYMNEYNSPLQQMLRYQDAGINPNLVAAQSDPGNMGSSHSGASPRGSTDRGPTAIESIQSSIQAVNSMRMAVETAQQIYDYTTFGKQEHFLKNALAGIQTDIGRQDLISRMADAAWSRYWNFGIDGFDEQGDGSVAGSPRAQYMVESTNLKSAQIANLEALIGVVYPARAQADIARAALADYQRAILKGENDAILQIDTGDPTRDAIFKLLAMKIKNTRIGLSL